MKLTVDRTGFPLVELGRVGSIHLWPVTKLQFETFLCEPGTFGDSWYESVCKYNSRISHHKFDKTNYEGLFMTALKPSEALEFARWLGEFDIPTITEWRSLYRALEELPEQPDGLSAEAAAIWERMSEIAASPHEFALMEGGLLEWTRENGSFAGLGAPRTTFLPNAWRPLDDIVRVINASDRVFYIGFRLIKRDPDGHSRDPRSSK